MSDATTLRWTPSEAWLMTEVVRRSLVAILDGGEPIPVTETAAAATIRVNATADAITIELVLAADRAIIALAPSDPLGHRWRDGWMLELERGDEHWYLSLQSPSVEIAAARRGPFAVHLRLQHRAITRELAGEPETVPVADVACYKYTRQSTLADRAPGDAPALEPWATPTRAERAPWWELDLGKAMHVAWLRIDLACPPPGTRVVASAYGFMMPSGEPPPHSVIFDAPISELPVVGDRVAVAFGEAVVARYVRIALVCEREAVLAVTAAEVLACEICVDSLVATLRRAFALYRDRPVFLERAGDGYVPGLTYGEVWSRSIALANGLARRLEPRADRVVLGIMLRSRPEWAMADLAALVRGYVSVPMSPDDSDDRLAQVIARARPSCVICEPADAERVARLAAADAPPPDRRRAAAGAAPAAVVVITSDALAAVIASGASATVSPPAPRAPDDLYSVLFTSGSTGTPKGAMRSYATFFAMMRSHDIGHSPRHLSFQPLSHLSERMYLPALLAHGGAIAYSRGGAHLLDELRLLAPTTIGTVPRLFEVLFAGYQRKLAAAIRAEPDTPRGVLETRALAEARGAFGDRVFAISVGSAPVSAEVLAFLKRCFADIWVSEGYGSTEVGTIASDGKVSDDVQVKLVPLAGQPQPPGGPERGEIYVLSPHRITGYLGDPDATAAAFDADGYFATGDLGERDAEGRVRVVGRVRNTVKLQQGEFVSAERIETALAPAPIVDRIYIHAEHGAIGVAALVVPQPDVIERARAERAATPEAIVLGALRARARAGGLAAYEIPRGVLLVTEPFTVESGLLTGSGKLARGAIAARFGARLAQLASGELAPVEDVRDPDDDDLAARVVRVAGRVLGRAVGSTDELGGGVDSLAAAEILAALADELGRDVPLAWWFESRTFGDLAIRLAHFAADTGKPTAELAAADLALASVVVSAHTPAAPRHVLLTGATGFLGAHLVEALQARSIKVTCLVRAPDTAAARAKLAAALADRAIPGEPPAVIAADLADADLAAKLASLDVDPSRRRGATREAGRSIDVDPSRRRGATREAGRSIDVDPSRRRGATREAGRSIDALAVDAIVHAGAQVSWLASYTALRGANVRGTHALLAFAASRGLAFHHVSTISTAPADGDETSQLSLDAALASTPYGLSKWVAEQHVRRAAAAGLAVAIYRPAMIAGHSQRGIGNADDFLNRYMTGCRELGLYIDRDDGIIDMTPVDFVAAAIAALVARPCDGRTYQLANIEGSMSFAALGRGLAAAGLAVAPATYSQFRAALGRARTSRLHALSAFFPEQFTLGMGPWPCARTVEDLAALGVTRPKIDDAIIARYVAALLK